MSFEYDITPEITAINNARYGRDVRQTIVNALTKLNTFAASIDVSSIGGGNTTVIISNGTLYRLEDFSEYRADATPTEMTTIIRNAITTAKASGFPGMIFPNKLTIVLDRTLENDSQNEVLIPVPDNFGLDLNESTIVCSKIPTVINADGSYDVNSFDTRPTVIIGMACNNSYVRNGTIDGGRAEVFPESYQRFDSKNAWPGTGIVIDGSDNIVDNVKIINCTSDGIRIDRGSVAGIIFGVDDTSTSMRYDRKGPEFMFKGDDMNPEAEPSSAMYTSPLCDFKYENGKLVSRWVRLSGGFTIPEMYLTYGGVRPMINGRGVDFIENEVKMLNFRYNTGPAKNGELKLSPIYTMEFADDSHFSEYEVADSPAWRNVDSVEGTFAEPDSSYRTGTTLHFSKECRIGYNVGFERFGRNTNSNRVDAFEFCDPLSYEFVKLTDTYTDLEGNEQYKYRYEYDVFMNGLWNGAANNYIRTHKKYYTKNQDGTFTLVPSSALSTSNVSIYYIKKSPLPLVRVKIPVTGISSVDDIDYVSDSTNPRDDIDAFGYQQNTSLNGNPPLDSKTFLRGIVHPCERNVVSNVTILNCGRNGVTIGETQHSIIENFLIAGCSYTNPRAAIDIEEGGLSSNNNIIRNGIIRDCRTGISFTSSQENFVRNVVISNCYFGMYAMSTISFSCSDTLIIKDQNNQMAISLENNDCPYSDFMYRRFDNCTFYGSVKATGAVFEKCRFSVVELFTDKLSRVSNSIIRPFVPGGAGAFCGCYYNCDFRDFGQITRNADRTRGFVPANLEDVYESCTFVVRNFDMGRTTLQNRDGSYSISPIQRLSNCHITCDLFSNVSAISIDNCMFENFTTYNQRAAITANKVSNCIFKPLFESNGFGSNFSTHGIIGVNGVNESSGTNSWNPKTTVFQNNMFFITKNDYNISSAKPIYAVVANKQVNSDPVNVYVINNSCIVDDARTNQNGVGNIISLASTYSSEDTILLIARNNIGFDEPLFDSDQASEIINISTGGSS